MFCYHKNLKHLQMKKLTLLVFPIIFFSISLSAQVDKKDPLIVINGKISNVKLSSLEPDDIESMSVSKSQAAKDAYGILAENGVISIITKDYVKTDSQNGQPSKPLVLVDGEIFTSSLDSINIQEIESVSVRKDKSATATYGKAGENGVILITTKENS
jgi:TonB-dependent SusC/RagA subfamily outer membrane receptor